MSPLSPEQIKALLAKPKRAGRGKKLGIDTEVRDYQTWFKLTSKIFDDSPERFGEPMKCENPNCVDPRSDSGQVVAKVSGLYICRFCFLDGFMLIDPDQLKLGEV